MKTNRLAGVMLAGVALLGIGGAWAQPWNDDFNKATQIIQSLVDPDKTMVLSGSTVGATKEPNPISPLERSHAATRGGFHLVPLDAAGFDSGFTSQYRHIWVDF